MIEEKVIFNHDHYMKVYRARKARGLKVHTDDNEPIENHPLKGKTLISKKDGKLIHVQNIYKHWNKGYYYCIVYYTWTEGFSYIGYKSHGTRFIENISCQCDITLKAIKKFQEEYMEL